MQVTVQAAVRWATQVEVQKVRVIPERWFYSHGTTVGTNVGTYRR